MAVKSKKNFFDAIDFDEIGDSMDLWWNTIHDSYQFDAISKKKEFNAVVISPPVPIGANSNEMDTFMDGVSGNFTDTLPKFVFRARLKDVASHHVFWPDPCDPRFVEDAGGQENAIDWISKHMKVMAINATEVPKVGDTVRVKLNKQGIYTANAETAIMVGLVTSLDSIDPAALASLDSAECRTSLSKAFDGYNGSAVGVDPSKIRPPDYYYPRICAYFTQFKDTAKKIGIPPDVMAAFVAVESSGNNLAVRFEPHVFNDSQVATSGDGKNTVPYTPSAGGFSRVASETNKAAFEAAFKLHKKRAIRSTSFGSVQVLGQALLDMNSGNPDKAKAAFFGQKSGDQTISKELVVRWFKGRPAAVTAANSGDFANLARFYNGPSYAANAYDLNIENASNSVSKCPSGAP